MPTRPAPARPFLKWAGGKRQLLPVLRQYYPPAFGTYYEPFLGSGAVFFDLHAAGMLDGHPAVLTDTNRDVIGCYLAVRDQLDRVIQHLRRLADGHAAQGAAHYYAIRDGEFNPRRQRLFARYAGDMPPAYPASLAAMFIYLNRTGYNGLFRLNRRGGFNVPVGRYTNPRICDVETLQAVHAALSRPNVSVAHASFDYVAARAVGGDFLYFDPPYAPLSATARFTAYTADGFDDAAQAKLQALMITLASRGCHLVLSNSSAPVISALYADHPDVAAAGLRIVQVPARRAINSRAARRGPVVESLIVNVPARDAAGAAAPPAVLAAPRRRAGGRPTHASRKRNLGVDSTIANDNRLPKTGTPTPAHVGGSR